MRGGIRLRRTIWSKVLLLVFFPASAAFSVPTVKGRNFEISFDWEGRLARITTNGLEIGPRRPCALFSIRLVDGWGE